MVWTIGEGTTFLFFVPICLVYSIWCVARFVSPSSSKKDPSQDTTGETTGRLKALNVQNPASVLLCMRYWAEFGCILLYIWMCEKAPPLPHGQRFSNSILFWGLWCLFVIWSLYNIVENKGGVKSATLLNREQSEEWKGWMQYLFLAYHYFHEASVYNAIRCFVSCYVWMTGFGNFSFFYTKADFGVVRMLQMMWRLNFLVFWLCLMFGNTFILYYINPLHTFYFLTTFFVMRIGYSFNTNKWKIRSKLFIWSVVIFILWEFPSVFNAVWGLFLGTEPNPGAKSGTLHEWHFRSSLDHWSAVFGMIFALNYPAAAAWLKRVEGEPVKSTTDSNTTGLRGDTLKGDTLKSTQQNESKDDMRDDDGLDEDKDDEKDSLLQNSTKTTIDIDTNTIETTDDLESRQKNSTTKNSTTENHWKTSSTYSSTAKIIVLLPLLVGTISYFIFVYPSNKKIYNALHPYYFWIPLLTYVVVRNFTPKLRRYHSSSLATMGKITLETYLMQHHIWLSKNAKALYVVIPNAPLLNLLVTSITYIFVALRLFRITVALRAIHVAEIGDNGGPWSCIAQVFGVVVSILIPYALSSILVLSNVATTTSFALTAFVITIVLGLVVIGSSMTCWKKYNQQLLNSISIQSTTATATATTTQHGKRVCGAKPRCCEKIPLLLLVISICVQLGAYLVWPSTDDILLSGNARYANPNAYMLWNDIGQNVINYKGIHEQGNDMLWRNQTISNVLLSKRTISIYGDSIGRETMKALGRAISGVNKTTVQFDMNDRHKDKFFTEPNGAILKFYWSPFAAITAKRIASMKEDGDAVKDEIIVISNAPWDMLHHPCLDETCGGKDSAALFAKDMDVVLDTIDIKRNHWHTLDKILSALWIAPTLVKPDQLPLGKKNVMTIQACWNYRQSIIDRKDRLDEILDGTTLTQSTSYTTIDLTSNDGVHYDSMVYDNLAQGLLNYITKPIPLASLDPRKKQSLAGISHNVLLGSLVLIALTCMLLTFDVYLGFSNVARILLGIPDIDYEAVYDTLHKTISKAGKLW